LNVIDERWSEDADELGAALADLLTKLDGRRRARTAEAAADGRDTELEKALEDFGLWELPAEPELLARASYEIGRAIAPVPFVELTPARIVLGRTNTAYGVEGPVPAVASAVVIGPRATPRTVANTGRPRRTTAGDYLVTPLDNGAIRTGTAADVDRMARLIRLLDAARLVGAGQELLRLGRDYAMERHAFGRPIGSFQAVAHRLVDSAVALDGAELVARKAAYFASSDRGGDGAPQAYLARTARALAVDAARLAATNVHQVMGGYGFTLEYDCQLYSRRIRSWSLRLAGQNSELAAIGRSVIDPASRGQLAHVWSYELGMPLPRWAAQADNSPVSTEPWGGKRSSFK
jgi:Acyl-CoA dehydrogenase, C-terminal domain